MSWSELAPWVIATLLGTPGATAAAVYFMLNGSKSAIRRIDHVVQETREEVGKQGQRIARIEGRLDK